VCLWLYQPYLGQTPAGTKPWRDRLVTARAHASRIATIGASYSVEVLHARSDWMLRDCDAFVAVNNSRCRSGGTVTALSRVLPGTPVIHIDVHNLRTTFGRLAPA
jgi:hypothetical protein